jgi:filamentous hemagglutinin family protein
VWAIPIVPNADGTNTEVNLSGNQFDITGGLRSKDGRNLFHSFKDFNLNSGQIANFISTPNIQNILGRINGGNISVINGLLQVSGGNSNLFLLNLSGIVFGKNAMLNVPAAFTATTANGIQFGNGWFSATGANDYEALNGAPIGFAFSGSQPGAIVNAGNLAVGSGQNLTLLSGTVASTGSLAAPNGQVTVSAVPGTSYVRLSQSGQLLSLEVQPLTASATQPNADSLPVASLPELLTGPGAASATGLTVTADGTVQLTGTDIAVAPGDVTVKSLDAGTANLSAANTLSLVESQITTAQDLTLSSQGTIAVWDSKTSPVAVKAGGNLTVTGSQGIDVTAINVFTTTALQSGGNLKLASDGLINVDASLSSGSDLSFLNLTGGTGNLFNGNQTILQSKGVVNLGNYTGVSLKVEADGSIRGGDITITGRKKTGVDKSDPDYDTLTYHPALILRAGLTEPASIISVGNVTAHGGIVDFSTNGNIFTGNIDVSPDNPINIYGSGNQRITLKGYNIFTGNLNAGSDIAPGTYTYQSIPYSDRRCLLSDLSDYLDHSFNCGPASPQAIQVPSGSISLDATQYLRTGDINASSRTGNGGNVTIQASDAIVGSINTSGSKDFVKGVSWDRYAHPVDIYYSFDSGNVSVKTDTFKVGAISTDGGKKKGTVEIETSNLPTDGGQKDGTVAIEKRDAPTAGNGPGETGIVLPPANEMAKPEVIRHRILVFTEARKLAGQKLTAQEIADKLEIPLELSQIAVLIPIGDSIKVPTPDLSELYNGRLYAGDGDALDPCGWPCKVIWGAGELSSWALKQLIKQIFQSKNKPKDSGKENGEQDQELSPEESDALTPKEKARIRNLEQYKNKTAAEAIRERGGGQGQVKELQSGYGEKTVAELAKLAAKGDEAAETALKIIKQAGKKKQKYGGK